MKRNDEINDLLARYAAEVGRYLPRRGRGDIEREIAANLADTLEDAVGSREPTLDDAVELLRKTGHPRVTAASYGGERHLVGPSLYLPFAVACRVALPLVGVVVLALSLFTAVAAGWSSRGLGEQILQILGSTSSSVFQAFALIVIVFFAIERLDPRHRPGLAPENWDPRRLPRALPATMVKLSEQIVTLVFNTIFIVILVLLPASLPVVGHLGGPAIATIELTDDFRRLVPLLVALFGVEIMAALFLMSRRSHTMATRIMEIAVKGCAVAAFAVLLAVWPLVVFRSVAGASSVPPSVPFDLPFLESILNQVIRGAFVLGIVVSLVEIAQASVRLARQAHRVSYVP